MTTDLLVSKVNTMNRKEQILELAIELVQTRGYSAFSYQDLSSRLGISKPAVHHHFPTKESLGLAVAKKYHQDVRECLLSAESRSDDPWKQFDGYIRMVYDIIKTKNRICAAGSVQSEFIIVPESMREEMAKLVRFVISWIARVIERGRKTRQMAFHGNPKSHATFIFTAVQGALQLGRAQGRKQFDIVISSVKQSLQAT